MSVQEMHRWGWILIGMASVLGLVLALLKGPIVIALGLAGIAIAWLYSAPAVQLSGKGVGEFFLMIAFGVLPVCGAAWLQSGVFDLGSLLIAIPVGIWVMLILWINEVPDRKADAANGKRRSWSASDSTARASATGCCTSPRSPRSSHWSR